jgi:hypothetical protein
MSVTLLTQVPSFLDSENTLADFVAMVPFSAHLRDVKTDKFILANNEQAKNHGLKAARDVIGLTGSDLQAMTRANLSQLAPSTLLLLDKHYQQFNAVNHQVAQEKQSVVWPMSVLWGAGFIWLGKIFKYPLVDQQGKTTAVFTFAIETTKSVDLLILYRIYKEYLPKKIAIQQLLTYLQIAPYFTHPPTDAELIVLLKMREISLHKSLAQGMHIKPVTIEAHLQRLRDKLMRISLDELLIHLRNFHYAHQAIEII